jgi:hypothetical protein
MAAQVRWGLHRGAGPPGGDHLRRDAGEHAAGQPSHAHRPDRLLNRLRFARHMVWLCDLDCYRPGPYVLDRDRQYGSPRFMAPEEFAKGATVDERSTVLTLGRAAFVLLSRGPAGEQDRGLWRAGDALFQVATTAARPDPADRYQSVAELIGAWQHIPGQPATTARVTPRRPGCPVPGSLGPGWTRSRSTDAARPDASGKSRARLCRAGAGSVWIVGPS